MMKNLTDYIPNTVKLSTAEVRLVEKLMNDYSVVAYDDVDYGVNPTNGVSLNVNPLVAALVEFIHTTYASYNFLKPMTYNRKKVPVALFDRVRYLVLKLDRRAYSELVD
jgi:hypothetical protein